jgi:hypothetical protein
MLYIHQLKDLTPKSADIEVVPVIREIKTRTPYPLRGENVKDYLELFYVSESEKKYMGKALEQIPSAIADIQALENLKDPDYELVNLQRATAMLKEIPPFLLTNLNYARDIGDWQQGFVEGFASLFNIIPNLKNKGQEEKVAVNNKLNSIFEKILRSDNLSFNYRDVVSEGQKSRMADLSESMAKGFFFKVLLEEEIKKQSFELIRSRIPGEKLRKIDFIRMKIDDIKKGVDTAYDLNFRMINWALVVYGYIKWLSTVSPNK